MESKPERLCLQAATGNDVEKAGDEAKYYFESD